MNRRPYAWSQVVQIFISRSLEFISALDAGNIVEPGGLGRARFAIGLMELQYPLA